MNILAYFTSSGLPATGLSPTIRVRNVVTTGLVVTDQAMIEVGDGFYSYDFTGYDAQTDYSIRCDGGVSQSDAERYTYAGNENYYDDIAESTWTATLSAYYPGPNAASAIINLLYGDYIHVDAASQWSGTSTFAIGTKARPVNNIGDAVSIANSRFIRELMLHSSVTVDADDDIGQKAISTLGVMGTLVTLTAGCSADGTSFRNLDLTGELSNGDTIIVNDCSMGSFVGFTGIMNKVALLDGSELTFGPWASLIDCLAGGSGGNEPEFTMDGSDVSIHKYTGNIKIMGKTGANTVVMDFVGGNVNIDSSCVAGKIQLLGTGQLEADDSGAGCNVDTDGFITLDFIADGVWNEDITTHVGADSTGQFLYDTRDIIPIIESQRGEHTGGYGNILYVDPVNGTTHALGARGGRSDPYSLVQDCHDNAVTDSNHDIVILVPGGAAGSTTLTEDVTLSKRYTFYRGPGRDFLWTRSGVGDTISVTGDGIELKGFQLSTDTIGVGHGIDAAGSDFVAVRRVWINYTRGDGINVSNCSNMVIEDNTIDGAGVGGAGHGITIDPAGGASNNIRISRNHIDSIDGNGVRLIGGSVQHSIIEDNQIHDCTGWGITIGVGVADTFIGGNQLGNNASGDIEDLGTDTVRVNNKRWATETDLKRALGLMHENIYIDNPGYDGDSNLVGARVRIYSDAASVGTANNVIGTYQIGSTGAGRGRFSDWRQVSV